MRVMHVAAVLGLAVALAGCPNNSNSDGGNPGGDGGGGGGDGGNNGGRDGGNDAGNTGGPKTCGFQCTSNSDCVAVNGPGNGICNSSHKCVQCASDTDCQLTDGGLTGTGLCVTSNGSCTKCTPGAD